MAIANLLVRIHGLGNYRLRHMISNFDVIKVVRDPCQKITLLLLKSKSVRVIVPESCFLKENTYL